MKTQGKEDENEQGEWQPNESCGCSAVW